MVWLGNWNESIIDIILERREEPGYLVREKKKSRNEVTREYKGL